MPSEIECRANQAAVECRSTASNGLKRLGGLAAAFGSPSQLLPGGFHEIVSPGAFAKSKSDGWPGVLAKFEHRDVLGSIRGNTLVLDITPRGLDYTVDVVPSSVGEHAYALAQRGDLASSFAFFVLDDRFELGRDGIPVRYLDSVLLLDVSCVATPAYSDATCAMRSLARQMSAPYEDVQAYAENGRLAAFFSRSDRPEVRGGSGKRRTWQQAQTELMGMALDPVTGKPYGGPPTKHPAAVEAMRQKSRYERELELMAMRWAPEPEKRTVKRTWRQAWVETEAMNPLWLE
jgi:uncharacterized protein